MKLIPAIDLKEGKAVRLKQGRMDDDTVFSDNPVEMADRWVAAGTEHLHLVDLDGAFAGEPVNKNVIETIVKAHPQLTIQVGGGIRDEATAQAYVDVGMQYVIIGSQAVKDPGFVTRLCKTLPGHVIVGLDAKQGKVATEGWAEDSGVDLIELAKRFEGDGVEAIIFTDIARDGMMQGLNLDATIELAQSVDMPVIASGGVTDMQDIKALCAAKGTGVVGTIIGRAIYEGTLNLREAQDYAKVNGL